MATYFNPGCALSVYKPYMETRLLEFLNQNYADTTLHKICCHHDPALEPGSLIINVCAGCDRRFTNLYEGISTVSLWEVLDGLNFPFPDYGGAKMSVQDACPVRAKLQVHRAIRNLLQKMNIEVVETTLHGAHTVCCGDDFYPALPLQEVHARMKARADSMPCEEVAVYCVSCIKAMHIGGKTPRYLVDLLFHEDTEPQTYDTVAWHEQLQTYIDLH